MEASMSYFPYYVSDMSSANSGQPAGGQYFFQVDAQHQEQQSHPHSMNAHTGSAAYLQNHSHIQETQAPHLHSNPHQLYHLPNANQHAQYNHGYSSSPDSSHFYHYDQQPQPQALQPHIQHSISLPNPPFVGLSSPTSRTGLDMLSDPPEGQNPGYSVKVLMEYAIKGSPTGRMSLNDIYEAVEGRYPQLKGAGSNWRNSARHDISMDPRFIKKPRLDCEPGKGHMWTFDPTVPPRAPKPRRKKNDMAHQRSTSTGATERRSARTSPYPSSSPSSFTATTPLPIPQPMQLAPTTSSLYGTTSSVAISRLTRSQSAKRG